MSTRKINPAVRLLLVLVAGGIGMLMLSAIQEATKHGSTPATPPQALVPPPPPTQRSASPTGNSKGPTRTAQQLTDELSYAFYEQAGTIIAQGQNIEAGEQTLKQYRVEEVALQTPTQFVVDNPATQLYVDYGQPSINTEASTEKNITLDRVYRITVEGGPFTIGDSLWYLRIGDHRFGAGGDGYRLVVIVSDLVLLPEGSIISADGLGIAIGAPLILHYTR